jgi:hypothetical protein
MRNDETKRPEVFPVPVVTRTRKNTVRIALWAIFIISYFVAAASGSYRWLTLQGALMVIIVVILMYRQLNRPAKPPTCSFCGKPQTEDRKLVAGPGVYICPSCVAVCQKVVDRRGP